MTMISEEQFKKLGGELVHQYRRDSIKTNTWTVIPFTKSTGNISHDFILKQILLKMGLIREEIYYDRGFVNGMNSPSSISSYYQDYSKKRDKWNEEYNELIRTIYPFIEELGKGIPTLHLYD